MRHRPFVSLLFILLLSIAATITASAHHLPPGMEDVDEFADHASFLIGFNHPLTGLDHLAVAVLTGWLVARLTGWVRAALISGSVFALLGGMFLAVFGVMLPAVEAMIIVSVVLAVVVNSLGSMGRLRIGAGILICFQFWHGNVHLLGTAVRSTSGMYLAGVCVATVLAMMLGLSLALLAKRHLTGVLSEAQTA